MANSRLTLHAELCTVLGSSNVYFQPPESLKLVYPCIIYSRADIKNRFASNDVYNQAHMYKVIVVDQNPDSIIVDKMSKFKTAKHTTHYKSNNLNHDVFTIFYQI